jgi:single-strand DNA-binding protein
MSLYRVTIIGHLGQDPELHHLPTNGQAVTQFSVATDEVFTGKDGTRQARVDWHKYCGLRLGRRDLQGILEKGASGVRRGSPANARV